MCVCVSVVHGNYTRMLRAILNKSPHKAPAVRPPTSHHENYQS